MKRYITAAIAMCCIQAQAQQVQQVTVGDNFNYGITYHLPSTEMQFTINARCTQTVAGPYAPYAEKFLGLKDVALTDQTHWEIVDISMKPVPVADPLRTYHITFSEKGATPTFYLTEDLCLWAINRAPEVATDEEPVPADVAAPAVVYKATDVLTPEVLKASSKSKQAELVANEIFNIRESRSDLIRGEADNTPNDGRQLQLMLDNLTAQEAALMTLFTGVTTVKERQFLCPYMATDAVESEILFRFSTELGYVEPDDLAGSPYYISVKLLEDNRMPEMDEKARKKLEKGIAHCVPGKVHVTLSDMRQPLAEGDAYMAQFGHVEMLPQGQFIDKKKPCAAVFVPSTGAIRSFEQ